MFNKKNNLVLNIFIIIALLNVHICYAANNEKVAVITTIDRSGKSIIRLVTSASSCPSILVDNQIQAMNTRTRPFNGTLSEDKPAIFPDLVCELTLSSINQQARFEGKELPKINAEPKKIILLGDTGCRMKAPDEFQACENASLWPLAKVAVSAAAEKPDLVIHVGDYHYRENKCTSPGCEKSPHGYGFDTWSADFFEPLKPLLEAAPWVFTRGNHESCQRAGQGWYRYLDPDPFNPERACETKDSIHAEFSTPYAISLGPDQQLIVFDSSGASEKQTKDSDRVINAYQDQFKVVEKLAENKPKNWLVLHHPVLGYGYLENTGFYGGNYTLVNALKAAHYAGLFPKNIQLALQGHIHTFELNSFAKNAPLSLITGFGGSQLEPPFSEPLPGNFEMVKDIKTIQSLSAQNYGYSTLEKMSDDWVLKQKDINGKTRLTCHLDLIGSPEKFSCQSEKR